MLESSEQLLKNYLWKYVDLNINNIDIENIKRIYILNDQWTEFLDDYKKYVRSNNDLVNFNIILSQLNEYSFQRFMIFFGTIIYSFPEFSDDDIYKSRVRLKTIDDLKTFIGDDINKFKLFILSLYYYL
jgi:hypothetical protein